MFGCTRTRSLPPLDPPEGTLSCLVCFLILLAAMVAGPIQAQQWDPVFGVDQPPISTVVGVFAFTEYDGDLIVAGRFRGVGGAISDGVASWNPASGWDPMNFTSPEGAEQPVGALAVYRGTLYAGGVFNWLDTSSCSPDCQGFTDIGVLALWNVSTGLWERVEGGPKSASAVRALEIYNDGDGEKLYVGGQMGPPLPGTDTINLVTWEGVNEIGVWGTVRGGVRGEGVTAADAPGVWDLLAVNAPPLLPGLYVAGQFSAADNDSGLGTIAPVTDTRGIARWHGGNWHSVGGGLNAASLQCPTCGLDGGPSAVSLEGKGIGPIPIPCVPYIAALEIFDGGFGPQLYAGGSFHEIGISGPPGLKGLGGPVEVNNIARWDGSGWSPLGAAPNDGVNGVVAALEVIDGGDALAVGGQFSTAACLSVPANNVARWSTSSWAALNGGLDGLPTTPDDGNFVQALHLYGPPGSEFLYAGGFFDCASNGAAAGASPSFRAFGVARWGCLACACQGDIDFDGMVGINDYLILLAEWGDCAGCSEACRADLDGDGTVGSLDHLIVLSKWGACP